MEHLTLRGSVYQFRMRVPQDLKMHYDGREEIKHSLKTQDRSKARGLAAIRTAELETEFAKLRAGIPKQDKRQATLTPDLIDSICSQWESHNLYHDDKDREGGFEYGQIGEEFEERLERLRELEAALRTAVGRGQHEIAEPALQTFLYLLRLSVSTTDPLYAKLRLEFARTAARTAAKQLQRAEGIEVPTPDALPMPESAAPPSSPNTATDATDALMFGTVIKDFLGTYLQKRKPAMYRKHQPVLSMLLEVIGDKPVAQLRQADINEFFQLLQRLPPRWSDQRRKQNLSIRKLAALDHPMTLGPKAFEDTYLASVRSFLKVARTNYQDQGFPTTLTTEGIQYHGEREEGESKQRAFRHKELKRLFEGEEMKAFAAHPAQAHYYWLPHVGLYTGARVNEICQLNPQTDILRDPESGIWYFWITDQTEGHDQIDKRTKNQESRRKVPVHSKLIELGLLDYVDRIKKQGARLLFPEWKPTRGKASGEAEKWFRQFIRDIGLRDDTSGEKIVGMHAFRHTLESTAQNTRNLPWPIEHISGHAIPGVSTVARKYKGELSLVNKQATLEAIRFELEFTTPARPTPDA